MTAKRTSDRFDPSSIEYPSDAVSLGAMRKLEPQLFQNQELDELDATGIGIVAAHRFELRLAEKAFASAMSTPDPDPSLSRKDIAETLDEEYRRYGLSSGPHQTELLMKEIENAARQQAARLRGQSGRG